MRIKPSSNDFFLRRCGHPSGGPIVASLGEAWGARRWIPSTPCFVPMRLLRHRPWPPPLRRSDCCPICQATHPCYHPCFNHAVPIRGSEGKRRLAPRLNNLAWPRNAARHLKRPPRLARPLIYTTFLTRVEYFCHFSDLLYLVVSWTDSHFSFTGYSDSPGLDLFS